MKTVKHITKEGSGEHILWWDTQGCHCSEPDCEINKQTKEMNRRLLGKKGINEFPTPIFWSGRIHSLDTMWTN